MTQRVLSVWLPNWPIQRLLASKSLDGPEASLPTVLVSRDPRRGQLVVACCALARRARIKAGMSGGEASSLLEAASDGKAKVQKHDAQADFEALEELAQECMARFSPIVATEPPAAYPAQRGPAGNSLAPQGLLMDMTSIGNLFGSEQELCREIDLFFRSHSLHAKIALANNLASAWGLARFGHQAIDLQPPARFLITDSAREIDQLLPLPTQSLRLDPACVDMLARLGVERFGELLRLPREGLATRLGSELILRMDQMLGSVPEPLPTFQRLPEDSVEADLDYPTRNPDILGHALEQLVQQLAGNLESRQHGALRVNCRFDLVKSESMDCRIGLFNPTADAGHLHQLIASNFSRLRFKADVHRIVVAATLTGPLMQRQADLIDGAHTSRCSSQALSNLVDNLSGRLGREAVLGVRAYKYPVPEDAFRLQPLTGQPVGEVAPPKRRLATRTKKKQATIFSEEPARSYGPLPEDPLRRPLQLIREPIELNVLEIQKGTPPMRFRCQGKEVQTHQFWGPERIESGWWRGESVRRDYFRIETVSGQWLWVFRRLTTNEWFLHGHFA